MNSSRNSEKMTIGEFLYKQNQKYKETKEKLVEDERRKLKEESSKSFVQEKSILLIEKIKDQVFEEIFSVLDNNGSGNLTPNNLNQKG